MDVAKLAAVVANIKSKQNNEKNFVDVDVATGDVAQAAANADGRYAIDITPSISQGDGQGNRHGNSLKLTGMNIPISFVGQSNTHSARKIVVSLLKVKSADNGVTAVEAFEHFWDVNPLNGLRDANAPRNYRNSSHDGISLIRQKTYMLKATHQNLADFTEQSHFTANFKVKLDDILRYHANADALPKGIRYIMVIQSDAGNYSGGASSLDIPITTINSGITFRMSLRAYYVDN